MFTPTCRMNERLAEHIYAAFLEAVLDETDKSGEAATTFASDLAEMQFAIGMTRDQYLAIFTIATSIEEQLVQMDGEHGEAAFVPALRLANLRNYLDLVIAELPMDA